MGDARGEKGEEVEPGQGLERGGGVADRGARAGTLGVAEDGVRIAVGEEEDGGEEEVGEEVGGEMVEDEASEYGEDQRVLAQNGNEAGDGVSGGWRGGDDVPQTGEEGERCPGERCEIERGGLARSDVG